MNVLSKRSEPKRLLLSDDARLAVAAQTTGEPKAALDSVVRLPAKPAEIRTPLPPSPASAPEHFDVELVVADAVALWVSRGARPFMLVEVLTQRLLAKRPLELLRRYEVREDLAASLRTTIASQLSACATPTPPEQVQALADEIVDRLMMSAFVALWADAQTELQEQLRANEKKLRAILEPARLVVSAAALLQMPWSKAELALRQWGVVSSSSLQEGFERCRGSNDLSAWTANLRVAVSAELQEIAALKRQDLSIRDLRHLSPSVAALLMGETLKRSGFDLADFPFVATTPKNLAQVALIDGLQGRYGAYFITSYFEAAWHLWPGWQKIAVTAVAQTLAAYHDTSMNAAFAAVGIGSREGAAAFRRRRYAAAVVDTAFESLAEFLGPKFHLRWSPALRKWLDLIPAAWRHEINSSLAGLLAHDAAAHVQPRIDQWLQVSGGGISSDF